MSQVTDFVTPGTPLTMAGLKTFIDACYGAIISGNSGATAPANPVVGMPWIDTSGGATAYVFKVYAAGGWVSLFTFNSTAGTITGLSALLDEDDMASDSAVLPPSQQSALAYFMAKTGANLAIGSDADGDMWYRAAGAMARLAKGPANTKLFMNAAGTGPEWAKGAKVGSFQFNLSGASGVQSITGVGFKPSHGIFITGMNSTVNVAFGIDNGTDHFVACSYYEAGDGWYFGNAGSMMVYTGAGGINKSGYVSEWTADGFEVTWTRNGETPDLVADVFYMVWR